MKTIRTQFAQTAFAVMVLNAGLLLSTSGCSKSSSSDDGQPAVQEPVHAPSSDQPAANETPATPGVPAPTTTDTGTTPKPPVTVASRKVVNFKGHVNLGLKSTTTAGDEYIMFFKMTDLKSDDAEAKDLIGGIATNFEFGGTAKPGLCKAKISSASINYQSLAFTFNLSTTLSSDEIAACNEFVTALKAGGATVKLTNPMLQGNLLPFDMLLTIQAP